ncbi:MAG: AAA family ATPase [Planctomycetaceae bacterium]
MLKALELYGFKSFADRTRFEFPAGITVVVGPNGSGKSNIVDGIKWVLGEQSAKSLRGKDMADVIFKGSGNSGRKPMNTAEATLILDNSTGHFPLDAPEVHITRRVYRSGEGEYLINRQPARLKDIRDMMRGTGVGTDAYSMIEQGKVDKLLQASAKDRRAIFEEAAGISRFKAKKVEAQRRLERVDQNLLRLSDIVDEVDSRLKSVRNQASKARRYREHAQRLQELRTHVAQADWRKASQRIEEVERELGEVRANWSHLTGEAELLEASLAELETAATRHADELRAADANASRMREQISSREISIAQLRSRVTELHEQSALYRQDLLALSDRAGDSKQRLRATQIELEAAQTAHAQIESRLNTWQQELASLGERREAHLAQSHLRREQHTQGAQAKASLESQVDSVAAQLSTTTAEAERAQQQWEQIAGELTELQSQLAASRQLEQQITKQLEQQQAAHAHAKQQEAVLRQRHAQLTEALIQLQGKQRGMQERANLLEELERNYEGLGSGVKEFLERAAEATDGPLKTIRGVLADFVAVRVEHAAALDMALGEAAQYLVVDGDITTVNELVSAGSVRPGNDSANGTAPLGLAGRVSFAMISSATQIGRLLAETSQTETATDNASLQALLATSGVVGTALSLVDIEAKYRPLVSEFLERTVIVNTLADAIVARQLFPELSVRFVTLAGEVLDWRGIVSVGPRQAATSLISRRSELRQLKDQLVEIEEKISELTEATGELQRLQTQQDALVTQAQQLIEKVQGDVNNQRLTTHTLEERSTQALRSQEQARAASHLAREQQQSLAARLHSLRSDLKQADELLVQLEASLTTDQHDLARLAQEFQHATEGSTAEKVELAKSEQRLEGLLLRLTQFEDDSREREQSLASGHEQLRMLAQRQESSEAEILMLSAELALLYIQKESSLQAVEACAQERDQSVLQRQSIQQQLNSLRQKVRKAESAQHELELSVGEVRHQRTTLVERLREDYGIDLATISAEATSEGDESRAAIEEEIETLRRKISQIGSVNLDALEELDELESRYTTLKGQFEDLTQAKEALEKIIQKINGDSRRLFLETLEAIRTNFQLLYRKAFGGGTADIVLEEGGDVLECGVEIVATPPGKPSFNNSLLSGGEKALTAVALLLAIFQFRPSPFCVLDEVDAPFDEANIGRFVDVLKEFLGWTKFVVVTHSKKTMTAATTLYGITMQESGVSKRVSVRFDDVTDDGHIKREAIDREGPQLAQHDEDEDSHRDAA